MGRLKSATFAVCICASLLLALGATSSWATTYRVGIGDDCDVAFSCFTPSQLNITVGDSVEFYQYADTLFTGAHNVVADDGSFRCARGCDGEGGDGTPVSDSICGGGGVCIFNPTRLGFTRTFNTPGVVAYHDEVSHASGVIVVQDAAAPAEVQTAVEYIFGQPWDYGIVSSYFVTSSPSEIMALDAGAIYGGWHRTGETFNVWVRPGSGALPVCRFFNRDFGAHFFTPYATECAWLQAEYGWQQGWQFEGIPFYLKVPDGNGNCPVGTTVLYRLYNDGKYAPPSYPDTKTGAPLHRLTTDASTFSAMRALGWEYEGDGKTFAFACVPSSAGSLMH